MSDSGESVKVALSCDLRFPFAPNVIGCRRIARYAITIGDGFNRGVALACSQCCAAWLQTWHAANHSTPLQVVNLGAGLSL